MMRYPSILSLALVALAAGTAAMAGDIYCNNQGRDCSDRPSPNATEVHVASAPVSATQDAAPPAGSAASPPVDAAADARLAEDASRQAVEKDVAATRADRCKQAKDKYQESIQAHRVYRMNKAGEREYLSDSDLDQARLNACIEMDRACGSSAP